MSVGRSGKKALMFLTVDHEVPANIMSTIAAEVPTDYIRAVRFVE